MTTIYMSQKDYRMAQRAPNSSERAHAICRKLLGCASQTSIWYGAHYWAACWLLREVQDIESLIQHKGAFAFEVRGRSIPGSHEYKTAINTMAPKYRSLWKLACRRVHALREEARALTNSNLW
jgi:hypothetical protein